MNRWDVKICIGALAIEQGGEAIREVLREGEERVRLENDGALAGAGPDEIEVFFRSPELNVLARRSPGLQETLEHVMNGRSLRWVQSGSAGTDSPAFHGPIERGVRLTNAASEPVAVEAEPWLRGPWVCRRFGGRVKQRKRLPTPVTYGVGKLPATGLNPARVATHSC